MKWQVIILLCLMAFLVGCKSAQMSIHDYQACLADELCSADVEKYRQMSYSTTKAATSTIGGGIPEALALIISNAVAFAVGVYKGKKKRG